MSDSPPRTVPESQVREAESPAPASTTLPKRAQNRYVFIAEHARGGLGRVWRVFDRELGRELALKESLADDAGARRRFVHEALTTARLEHPAIVPVHDAGTSDLTGSLFYTMKMVDGSTLAAVLDETPELPARIALLPRVLAVAEAVGYAHSKGVLHRDLKPENILVGKYGETVVIDWGLVRAVPTDEQHPVPLSPTLTRAGAVMGTPGYMAPEQAAGEEVDARADVYSLGACLAAIVTGRGPRVAATDFANPDTPPFDLSGVNGAPRDLLAIIKKAMAAQRRDRYADAQALAEDLNRYLARQPVRAHEYSLAERLARWVQQHRSLSIATATALVLAALAATLSSFREAGLRKEAEASTRALLEVEGRSELAAGHPRRAAVYFAEALKRAPNDVALRALLGQSVRAIAARRFALEGMQRDVVSVDWSRDGKWLATGGDDDLVRVWDAERGTLVKAFPGHSKSIDDVSFSADSRFLTSGGGDHKVRVFRLDTLEEAGAFDDPNPYRVIFSPDGSKLVVGDQSGEVRVLDARTGARLHTLAHHTNRAQALAFAPTGELVVAAWDRSATVWSGDTFTLTRELPRFESEGASLAFSHDGQWAAVAESDFSIHLFRLPSWEYSHRIRTPNDSRFPAISFSVDDQQVLARSADGIVRTWHVTSGALLETVDVQPEGKLFASAVSPDATRVLTAGVSGSAVVWSLEGMLGYRVLPVAPAGRPIVLPGTVGESGRLALPDTNGTLTVVSPDGGIEARFDAGAWPASVALSEAAGTLMASNERSGYRDLKVRRLDGSELASVPHPRMIINVAVTRDGSRFATACYDGQVRVIDARDGKLLLTAPVSKDRLSAVAFSPDGTELAAADGTGVVSFVDARSGAVRRTLTASPTWIDDVEYSPDGKQLVTAGRQDHHVRVWRLDTLAQVHDFAEHTNNVARASFSHDGSMIASVAFDHVALLHDAATGQLLRSWRGPSQTAEFLPGDRELLTTGYDGYVVVWSLAPDPRPAAELIAFVGSHAPWELVNGQLVLKR